MKEQQLFYAPDESPVELRLMQVTLKVSNLNNPG